MEQTVISFVDANVAGVVVAAQSHLDGLSTTPSSDAAVLGALRRAVTMVKASYGSDGVTIQPVTVPGRAGQVGYRVQPAAPHAPSATGRVEMVRNLQQALVERSGRAERSLSDGVTS